MRSSTLLFASLATLAGCGSDENTVISGYPPAVISPVRSSMSAQVNFTDGTGSHQQWVIAMSDVPDLCTKVTAHHDYFQNAIESFTAILVWVPPGNIGTFFVGQNDPAHPGATVNDEVVQAAVTDAGPPQLRKLPGAIF